MTQHPKVTVGWAINGLESAICRLEEGTAERRVRDQFHQLLGALERDGHNLEATRVCCEQTWKNP
jgi:hypothetical protein